MVILPVGRWGFPEGSLGSRPCLRLPIFIGLSYGKSKLDIR